MHLELCLPPNLKAANSKTWDVADNEDGDDPTTDLRQVEVAGASEGQIKNNIEIKNLVEINIIIEQGGRTWQAFGGGKNGHETFRQARICNFRDKCVVFARNLKFSNLTQ